MNRNKFFRMIMSMALALSMCMADFSAATAFAMINDDISAEEYLEVLSETEEVSESSTFEEKITEEASPEEASFEETFEESIEEVTIEGEEVVITEPDETESIEEVMVDASPTVDFKFTLDSNISKVVILPASGDVSGEAITITSDSNIASITASGTDKRGIATYARKMVVYTADGYTVDTFTYDDGSRGGKCILTGYDSAADALEYSASIKNTMNVSEIALNVTSIEKQNYSLTIQPDANNLISSVDVYQNGIRIDGDNNVYSVSNSGMVMLAVKTTSADIKPYLYDLTYKSVTTFAEDGACVYDAEREEYQYKYRITGDREFRAEGRQVSSVKIDLPVVEDGYGMSPVRMVKYISNQYSFGVYDKDGLETAEDGSQEVVYEYVKDEPLYFRVVNDEYSYSKGVLAYDKELKDCIELTALPAPGLGASDAYRESFDDFSSAYLVDTSKIKDGKLYYGKKYTVKKQFAIPKGATVTYINSDEGVYDVSSDKKTLTIYSAGYVRFAVSEPDKYRVYYTYLDEEGRELKELLNREVEGYYSIDVDSFENIEIVERKSVNVSFACLNSYVGSVSLAGEYLDEGITEFKADAGDVITFSAYPSDSDRYYIEYVSLTGRKDDAIAPMDDGNYMFIPKEDTVVTVRAVPVPQNLTVINPRGYEINFTNPSIDVERDTDGDSLENDNYLVPYNVSKVEFTVKHPTGKVINTLLCDSEGVTSSYGCVSYEPVTGEPESSISTYWFYADMLKDDINMLYVSSAGDTVGQTLTVTYTTASTEDVILTDGTGVTMQAASSVESEDKTVVTYNVNYGKHYILNMDAISEYYVGNVKVTQGTHTDSYRCNNVSKKLDCYIYSDIAVDIAPYGQKKLYVYPVDADTSEAITPIKATQTTYEYGIPEGGQYVLQATSAGESIKIKEVNLASWFPAEPVDRVLINSEENYWNDGEPVIDLTRSVSKARIEFEDGTSMILILRRVTALTAIKVTGSGIGYSPANRDQRADLKLTADTYGRLNIVPFSGASADRTTRYTNTNSNLDSLRVEYESDGGNTYTDALGNTREYISLSWDRKQAGARNAYLRVSAGDIGGKTGKIKFYADGSAEPLATINVSTVDFNVNSIVKSAVSIKSADDTSVTFNIKGATNARRCASGKQYYRIRAGLKSGQEVRDGHVVTPVTYAYVPIEWPEYPDDATEAQIERIDRNFTQTYRMKLNDVETGCGGAYDFDFYVDYFQTKAGVTLDDIDYSDSSLYYAGSASELAGSTLDPTFALKPTVTTKVKNIYTGQSDITIATAGFASGVTCKKVVAEDVTDCENPLVIDVDDTIIHATALANTTPGTHKIEVKSVTANNMYVEPVYITINVVQGITSLEVVPSSSQIFKKPSAAATVSLGVIYNNGETVPKSRKVTYKLFDEQDNEIMPKVIQVSDEEGADDTVVGSELDGMITVSGATITINKKLNLEKGPVSFYAVAYAADYAGNEVSAKSQLITVTDASIVIDNAMILKYDREGRVYKVLGTSASKADILASDVDGAIYVAFKKGAPVLDEYYERDIVSYQIPITDYTLKSSDKKVTVKSDGKFYTLSCNAVANNIKLTAVTKDGGNKKKVLTLNSAYYKADKLAMIIKNAEGDILTSEEGALEASFKGDMNTPVALTVKQDTDGLYEELQSITNYTVSVNKYGKIISSNKVTNEYTLLVTGKTAVVTLINKALPKTAENYKIVYKITNDNFVASAGPKVTVKNNLKSGGSATQNNSLVIKKTRTYDPEGKYVVLTMDEAASRVAKTADAYEDFYASSAELNASEPIALVKDEATGVYNVDMTFDDTLLATGKYKVVATFGTMDGDEFVPDAKSSSVVFKVVKPKGNKGKLTITAKYKLVKDAETEEYKDIEFKYSGKLIESVTFTEIFNANVGGVPNDFTDYFELSEDGTSLVLISDLSEEDKAYITSVAGKNDRVAYIRYNAKVGDDGFGNPYNISSVIKVTINM